MFRKAQQTIRYIITAVILAGAAVAAVAIWAHYFTAPWTRDGQVLAYVVNQAPEVSGRIVRLNVVDNQAVRRGDVLYEIDPVDYQVSLANAQASVNSRQTDLQNKRAQAERRAQLTTLSTSREEQQNFGSSAEMAASDYAAALTQLSQAKIDLERTKVLSPVNGYVTNLQLQVGDYATKGTRNLALLDRDSFWIVGYFEETKLATIRPGDPALAALMGFRDPVRGRVESIARGINTPNTQPGSLGLATVNPVFTWVRLAQRIPVRIRIEHVPETVQIAAGMTATVTVGPAAERTSSNGLISRWLTQVGGARTDGQPGAKRVAEDAAGPDRRTD